MANTTPLASLSKTIRSKNAGVDKISFDVIFPDKQSYDLVRRSGALSREAICRLYGIPGSRISDHVEFEPGLAIKFTIYRTVPSGVGRGVARGLAGWPPPGTSRPPPPPPLPRRGRRSPSGSWQRWRRAS